MGVKDTDRAAISQFISYFIGRNVGQGQANVGAQETMNDS